ncbi:MULTISPECIES: hypothetical protein [Achromobacter]|uniref:Uncharacterized protein n=1 Tax=Achromobacter mucicolens TaxID=1389922 RepID=A0ABM8LKD6_9BURK|nr:MULTISPECIES: hypothetical protein [Achromobacter]AVG43851.1 hypothetical protein MC81_30515 [Achromobacter insolitus]CAB3846333.1 hypothetical protein LMG3410_01536 [Achromobacter aegrifaciens]CAB3913713.1 hypothetical protein LMG3415_05113 [Achromobacter mucicolens]
MDLDAFLNGSIEFTQNIMRFMFMGLSVLAGVICMYLACRMCVAQAQGQREGRPLFGPVVAHVLIGYFFLRLAGFSTDVTQLLMGSAPQTPASALSYLPAQVSQSSFWSRVALAIVNWVAMFGSIAVFRGLLLWREMSNGSPNQPGDLMWRGFWHIVFGTIALNIGGLF